ncbi:hypothetical protein IC575_017719 [Cucumis melo]
MDDDVSNSEAPLSMVKFVVVKERLLIVAQHLRKQPIVVASISLCNKQREIVLRKCFRIETCSCVFIFVKLI